MADLLSALAALVGLPLVAAALWFSARQTRSAATQTEIAARATRASVYQQMHASMQEISFWFVEHPEYRAYLYEGAQAPPAGTVERRRVEAMTELMVDFMDSCVVQQDCLPPQLREPWKAYFQDLVGGSPVFQEFWRERRGWYGADLQDLLDPVVPPAPRRAPAPSA